MRHAVILAAWVVLAAGSVADAPAQCLYCLTTQVTATSLEQNALIPEKAASVSYFPWIADGQVSPIEYWQLVITATYTSVADQGVILTFYKADGTPFALDFGSGPSSQVSIGGGPAATTVLTSTAAESFTGGWASAVGSAPFFIRIEYRDYVNQGTAQAPNWVVVNDISTTPTSPTVKYLQEVNANTGIAIANPVAAAINPLVTVRDGGGNVLLQQAVNVPANGLIVDVLYQLFPSLGLTATSSFQGLLEIDAGQTQQGGLTYMGTFVAWCAGYAAGRTFTLPDGSSSYPRDETSTASNAFNRLVNVFPQLLTFQMTQGFPPPLVVLGATAGGGSPEGGGYPYVQYDTELIRLMGDSEGEVAFALAHGLGHWFQEHNPHCSSPTTHFICDATTNGADREEDADEFALFLLQQAGYDTYSAYGAIAKLSILVGNGTLNQSPNDINDGTGTGTYATYAERIAHLQTALSYLCSSNAGTCSAIHSVEHGTSSTLTY